MELATTPVLSWWQKFKLWCWRNHRTKIHCQEYGGDIGISFYDDDDHPRQFFTIEPNKIVAFNKWLTEQPDDQVCMILDKSLSITDNVSAIIPANLVWRFKKTITEISECYERSIKNRGTL